MFTTLLVANRGEIAARIFRTGRALGLRTVAVYSDADRNAYHVRQADEAVRIGPAPAAQSYLSIEAILQAACCSGTDAIHPGYGFLSENPALAEACAAAGITFVGPPAQAMRLLGDKPAARQLARQHGIPVLPGYDGESQDDATLTAQAHAIGFPVMIKAAAGGGGRGMRLAPSGEAMAEALASARREAQAAFGDGRLLLERAVVGGRHIEVQILADTRGHIIHLGERDCSVQRRFQKVIEESPSPAVAPSMREQLGAAAVAVARAAGYVNSGTIEFLLDAEGQFSFLEMNTRLQVEHGVTELVSGLDLVELQLRIAAGEAIDLRQADVALSGHAIECRIYAEDPSRGYLPSPGRITEFLPPAGDGVRNDVGVTAGSDVPAEYDPLLAKLLVQASTRAEAVARCAQALAGYVVEGVRTNLTLLRCVLADPVYIAGNADLTTLDRIPADAFVPAVSDAALLAAAVADLLPRPWAETGNVWDALGVWRVGGRVELSYGNQGRSFSVQTERVLRRLNAWRMTIGERIYTVEGALGATGRLVVRDPTERVWQVTRRRGGLLLESASGEHTLLAYPDRATFDAAAPVGGHAANVLRAPMPGTVVSVLTRVGEPVRARQALVVLEAMKMEHTLEASVAGVVERVACRPGQRVAEGEILIEIVAGEERSHDDAEPSHDH